ncbi:MAG: GNAT family N-acetyltransferase [Magnetococcales bacterium]|nr:GNAT family N-acetyltransferase [Magnetococcales bacterium]
MNLFLQEKWHAFMAEMGAISGYRALSTPEGELFVGEVRRFRQTQWVLFGAPEQGQRTVLDSLFDQARQQGVFRIESRFNMARWREEELPTPARTLLPFGTYRLPLDGDADTLWKRLDPDHRRMIRKAREVGLDIRWEVPCAEFHALMEQTYAFGNAPCPYGLSYLQRLHHHLGSQLLSLGAFQNNKFVAGLLVPLDNHRAYYLHGARSSDAPPGTPVLLHWILLQRLLETGVAAYDLGGARPQTDDPRLRGIFFFKSRFGGPFEACSQWQADLRPWIARGVDTLQHYRELRR